MLSKQERDEKRIRSLIERNRELSRCRSHPALRKLNEPFQKGWKRLYVLSERACHRTDRQKLEAILPFLNSIRYCQRPDFKRRGRRSRRLVEIHQPLRVFPAYDWYRKRLPADWLKYFCFVRRHRQTGVDSYEFALPWLFDLHVEERWITHVRVVDPTVMSELARLDDHMSQHHVWGRYARLRGRKWRRWSKGDDPRQSILTREDEREMRRAIREGQAVDSWSSIRWTRFSRMILQEHSREALRYLS